MSEEAINHLEAQVPALSGVAFAEARRRVLASGQCVLQSEKGVIYKVFPNGDKIRVKEINPPEPVNSGSRFSIR